MSCKKESPARVTCNVVESLQHTDIQNIDIPSIEQLKCKWSYRTKQNVKVTWSDMTVMTWDR